MMSQGWKKDSNDILHGKAGGEVGASEKVTLKLGIEKGGNVEM